MSTDFRWRLGRRLDWQRGLHDPVREPRNTLATLPALRRWQAARLATSFGDFLADPTRRPAAEFFLADLYGDRDFSARDRDAARILPLMSRLLPEALLRAATDAIELAVLSHALDLRMAEALAMRPDPLAPIRDDDYSLAYRRVGLRRLREHQIGLILRVGHSLDAAVQKHGVHKLLKAARIPAQLAGLSELQAFLERGFTAFGALGGAGPFLHDLGEREHLISRRLFAGDPFPFAQANSSSI
ncbi:hypothetical protein BH11PSE14_BH11PSE14_01870 [soil metagenome]